MKTAWGHTSIYSGLVCVEASRARVSQSGLKTGAGAAQMVHVASSWRQTGRCDGLRRTLLPLPSVFFVLDPRGNLVFYYFAWAYK
jgi:hypothetical protein